MVNGLELQHINYSYNKKDQLFNDFNLSVSAGDFVFVLGANGSGKSTLLKLILGAVVPHDGKVLIGNAEIKNLSKKSSTIGYIPQSYALDHEMTVKDTINLIASLHGLSKSALEQRKSFLIDALGLEPLLDKRIKKLSGGQKQLVNISIGLIHDPDLLLIDEPFVGLDYGVKSKIITFLNSLNKTIICVSHDLELAESNATKMLLMEKGSIKEYKNPQEVISEHGYHLEELDLKADTALKPTFSDDIKVTRHNNRLIITCPSQESYLKEIEAFKAQHGDQISSARSCQNNLQSTLVGHFDYTIGGNKAANKKGKKKRK